MLAATPSSLSLPAPASSLLILGGDAASRAAALQAALRRLQRHPLFCTAVPGGGLYRQALLQTASAFELVPYALGVSSARCRLLLERALRTRPYVLVLDPAPQVPRALVQALGQLLHATATPLIATAPSAAFAAIGHLGILFPHPGQRLELAPQSSPPAAGNW